MNTEAFQHGVPPARLIYRSMVVVLGHRHVHMDNVDTSKYVSSVERHIPGIYFPVRMAKATVTKTKYFEVHEDHIFYMKALFMMGFTQMANKLCDTSRKLVIRQSETWWRSVRTRNI